MNQEYNKMKIKSIAMIVCCAAVAGSAVAQIPADTVVEVRAPRTVMVTKSGETTTVSISGSKYDERFNYRYTVTPDSLADEGDELSFNFPFSNNKSATGKGVDEVCAFRGIYGGAVIPVDAPGAMNTSWEAGVTEVLGYSYRRGAHDINIGLGLGYRNLSIGDRTVVDKDGDALLLTAAPDDASDVSSHIESWALHVPVMYTLRIHRTFGFSIGVVANINFYTTASRKYSVDDVTYTKKFKGLHQRLLTPDVLFTVGSVGNAGVYVRWSPVTAFKRAYGPQYKTVSVGLSVAF